MLRKRDVNSDKMDTLRRGSRNHITVLGRDWESANKRGCTSFYHDFNRFVTVRLLDETPAVPSLLILCSKHGYSLEWKNAKTPRLANNGKSITCTMDNFVLLVVPGLSSIPSSTSRSTDQ